MEKQSNFIKIPPFMDAHIHFVIDGRAVSHDGLFTIMHNLVKHGIFAVKEMGYKTGIGLKVREILLKENLTIPLKVQSSGFAVYKKGTYGVFLGKGISSKKEIKKTINEIIDAGADFIKVVNSGMVSSKGEGVVTPGGFAVEDLKAICEEAKHRNLAISCHANGDVAIRNAVEAGVNSIEHGFFISKETLHLMVEKGVSWTPTVFALLAITSFLPTFEKKYIEGVVEGHLSSINYAESIGLQLKIGTDSGSKGVKHGESIFEELALFKKAGLSFDKILQCICMKDEEVGKGNFLLVKRDFIETRKIEGIYHKHQKIG